jgi:hypothetical protein
MPRKTDQTERLDEYTRVSNQARFLEETSHGLFLLLKKSGKTKAWLARRLGCSRSVITKAFEGSNNFKLETLADIGLALGRAVHVTWGADASEMRIPTDELERIDPPYRRPAALYRSAPGATQVVHTPVMSYFEGARDGQEGKDRWVGITQGEPAVGKFTASTTG